MVKVLKIFFMYLYNLFFKSILFYIRLYKVYRLCLILFNQLMITINYSFFLLIYILRTYL